MCTEAGLLALRERRMCVTQEDFKKAKEKVGAACLLWRVARCRGWVVQEMCAWTPMPPCCWGGFPSGCPTLVGWVV